MYIKERGNDVARDKRGTNRSRYKPEVTHPATECQSRGISKQKHIPPSLQSVAENGAASDQRGRHRYRSEHLRHTSWDDTLMDSRARMCEHIGANERSSSAGERHPIGLDTASTPIISLPDGTHYKRSRNKCPLSFDPPPSPTYQPKGWSNCGGKTPSRKQGPIRRQQSPNVRL